MTSDSVGAFLSLFGKVTYYVRGKRMCVTLLTGQALSIHVNILFRSFAIKRASNHWTTTKISKSEIKPKRVLDLSALEQLRSRLQHFIQEPFIAPNMACIQFEQDKMKNKSFIKLLEDIRITGIKPAINVITLWSNDLDGEESHQIIELISRDGRYTQIGLENRRHSSSSDSEESYVMERRNPRKRARPQHLLDEIDKAGNCVCYIFFKFV